MLKIFLSPINDSFAKLEEEGSDSELDGDDDGDGDNDDDNDDNDWGGSGR